jgi:hypothetical protein
LDGSLIYLGGGVTHTLTLLYYTLSGELTCEDGFSHYSHYKKGLDGTTKYQFCQSLKSGFMGIIGVSGVM